MKKIASTSSAKIDKLVLDALRQGKYEYRTAEGLAKEINAPVPEVKKAISEQKDVVIKSYRLGRAGEVLYAARERVSRIEDIWKTFKALNGAKFG